MLRAAGHTVFLDSEVLVPGDEWTYKICDAQRQSLLTVILISPRSEAAYFQREEILQAISLARRQKEHRIIPIYLGNRSFPEDMPYGLKQLHGLALTKGTLLEVAMRVEAALELCKEQERQSTAKKRKSPSRKGARPGSGEPANPDLSETFSHTVKTVRDVGAKAQAFNSLKHDCHTPSEPSVCSIVYVDIDDFTVINKRFGVSVGDEISNALGNLFKGLLMYRWGGDEFLVYLPEIEEQDALRFAENLRKDIENHPWSELAPGLRITASLGVSERREEESLEDWLIRTICGANEAKKKGKNRVNKGPKALPRDMSRDIFSYGS